MSCSMCNLNLLTKKELIKFIQKIGHYQAARIIEEHKIDGSKILNLTLKDISKWHLTTVEEELLWKCMNELRLHHITEIDCQRLCIKEKKTPSEQKNRQSIYSYFKFKPKKKHNGDSSTEETEIILSKSFENPTMESDTGMDNDSGYNFVWETPSKRSNDALVNELKKYLTFNSHSDKYERLSNGSNSYMDLSNLTDTDYILPVVKYEILPVKTPREKTISDYQSVQYKKSKHVRCYFKLCCFSCGISIDN